MAILPTGPGPQVGQQDKPVGMKHARATSHYSRASSFKEGNNANL